MDTAFARGISVFAVPLLITGIPLALFLFLRQVKRIRQSTGLTTLAVVFSAFVGWWTPLWGTILCAGILANGMPDSGPKCVTGAVIFMPVGYLITCLTLVIGLGVTIQMLLRRSDS